MLNQNQIRNMRTATALSAASVGRPNEVTYVDSLNRHFKYVINGALVADSVTVLTANGVNAFWVVIGDISLKNNFIAIIAPTAADDSSLGYSVGSSWIDTVSDIVYTCVDSTATAAIWSTGTAAINNLVAVSPPSATSDAAAGYSIGSIWYNTALRSLHICTDATNGAAVWVIVSDDTKDNFLTNINPTAVDDSAAGYTVGSTWVNTVSKESFVCLVSTPGSAVWGKTNDATPVNNLAAIIAPVATDDVNAGYSIGSAWFDTKSFDMYICSDATTTAAVWVQVSNDSKDNFTATGMPTATDDSALGYSIGSHWVFTLAKNAYICVDATAGAAVWKIVNDTLMLNNFIAVATPTATDDETAGYSVSSHWYDTVNHNLFICSDATATAAVWVIVSNEVKNNYVGASPPTALTDTSAGYDVGSMWLDTIANKAYICVDSTVGSALWELTTPTSILYDGNAENSNVASNDSISPNMAVNNSLNLHGSFAVSGPVNNPLGLNIFVGAILKLVIQSTAAVTVTFGTMYKDANGVTIGAVPFALGDVRVYNFRAEKVSGVTSLVRLDDISSAAGLLNSFGSLVPPLATDDSSLGYSVGSVWVDNVLDDAYICVSSAVTAAIWKKTTTELLNSYTGKIVDPIATNDDTQGYAVGSKWINGNSLEMFVCTSALTGAAIWLQVSTGLHHNMTAAVNPTVTDDGSLRYGLGSIWINTTSNVVFICVDGALGGAIWERVSNEVSLYDGNSLNTSVNSVGTTLTPDLASPAATGVFATGVGSVAAPLGIGPLIAGKGALVKVTIINTSTTLPLVVTFDPIYKLASGTAIGAETLVIGEIKTYSFRYNFDGAADTMTLLDAPATVLNNFTATTAPTGTDDSAAGYSVGSVWVDVTNDNSYTCVDATVAGAVWTSQPVAPISPRDVMQVKIPGNNLFSAPNTSANMSTLVYSSGTGLSQAVGSGIKGLKAGVTYKISAVFWYPGNVATGDFHIRDVTAGAILNGLSIQMAMPEYGKTIETYFTPTVATELSLSTATTGTVYLGAGSSLSVEEVVTFPASSAPLSSFSLTGTGINDPSASVTAVATAGIGNRLSLLSASMTTAFDPDGISTGDTLVVKNTGMYELNYSFGTYPNTSTELDVLLNGVRVIRGKGQNIATVTIASFHGIFSATAGDILEFACSRTTGQAYFSINITMKELPPYTSITPDGPLPKYSFTPIGNTGRLGVSGGLVLLDGSGFAADGLVFDNSPMITSPTQITIAKGGEYLVNMSFRRGVTAANLQVAVNGVNKFRAASGGTTTETMTNVSGYLSLAAGDLITFTTGATVLNGCSLTLAKQP